MGSQRLPERLRWALQLLDVGPDDEVLEIGCGPGVAVSLVCERLDGGRITAIDRSAAIRRATERNASHLAAGRAILRQVDLAGLPPTGQRSDKIFAVNVNLFWTAPADAELRRLRQLLRPGGGVHLVYETPAGTDAERIAEAAAAALSRHGFAATVTTAGSPSLRCITATTTWRCYPRAARSTRNARV